MQCSPPFLAQFIDDERFSLLNLNQSLFFYIFREILKDVEKLLFILLLDLFQHLFTLGIQIFPDIKGFLLIVLVFLLLIICFLDLWNSLHVCLLNTKDVVEISLVNVDIFIFFLCLYLLQKLDINLHTFFDAVVSDRPSWNDSIIDLPLLDLDNEILRSLANPFLEVLKQLLCVFAEVDVYPLCFCLQYSVFIDQNKSHLFCLSS